MIIRCQFLTKLEERTEVLVVWCVVRVSVFPMWRVTNYTLRTTSLNVTFGGAILFIKISKTSFIYWTFFNTNVYRARSTCSFNHYQYMITINFLNLRPLSYYLHFQTDCSSSKSSFCGFCRIVRRLIHRYNLNSSIDSCSDLIVCDMLWHIPWIHW